MAYRSKAAPYITPSSGIRRARQTEMQFADGNAARAAASLSGNETRERSQGKSDTLFSWRV
jgi:hypothetical protein